MDEEKRTLEFGPGIHPIDKAIHLDRLKLPHVEVVHNLNVFPYPFSNGSFDRIVANHIIEHILDTNRAMEEIHRILKPEGTIEIVVVIYPSTKCILDPTHVHIFMEDSFDFWCPNTYYGTQNRSFTKAKFKVLEKIVSYESGKEFPMLTLKMEKVII